MESADAGRRLVLWRHGQTAWNAENRAQGQADVPMDEIGHQQARDAAPVLASFQPTAIWSSDLVRARDTAGYLSDLTGVPVRTDQRLREYQVGLREGFTFDEFREAHPQVHHCFFSDPDYRVPGAEGPEEVRERMAAVLHAAVDDLAAGQAAILVGHGAALTAGLLGFFGVPGILREMYAGMDNCAWATIHQHHSRGWQLVDYNMGHRGHIPSGDRQASVADLLR